MLGRLTGPLREEAGFTLAELVVTLAIFAVVMLGVVATWTKAQEVYFVGSETAEVQQNVRAAIDFMVREIRAAGRDVTVCAFDYAGPGSLDCTTGPGGKVTKCKDRLNLNDPQNGADYLAAGGCAGKFAIPQGIVFGITVPTAQAIGIRADRNDNGTIARTTASPADLAEEEVVYSYSTTACPSGVSACITRTDGTGTQAMVAVDIAGFTLTYYPRPGYATCGGVAAPAACGLPMTQQDADNVGRINIKITAQQVTAGSTVSRTLETDVWLRNRK